MKRLQLLSLHLRSFYNFTDYAKLIKSQANMQTLVVNKSDISKNCSCQTGDKPKSLKRDYHRTLEK